jgi:hypothetical protein
MRRWLDQARNRLSDAARMRDAAFAAIAAR